MAYIDQHVRGCGLGHLLWHWCNCFFLFNFSLLILGALVQVDVEPNWRMNLTNTIWPRLFRVLFCRTAEALRGRVEEITQHLANTPRYGAWEWVFGSDFGLSWARTSMVFPIICNVFGRSGFQASTGIVFQEVLQRPTKNCLVGNSWKGLTPLTINEAAYQILSVSHMETHVPVGLETALIQKLLLCRTFLHNFSFPSSISRWCKLMFYIYIYIHMFQLVVFRCCNHPVFTFPKQEAGVQQITMPSSVYCWDVSAAVLRGSSWRRRVSLCCSIVVEIPPFEPLRKPWLLR